MRPGPAQSAPVRSPLCPDRTTANRAAAGEASVEAPAIRLTVAGTGHVGTVGATSATRSSGSEERKGRATTTS